MSHSIKLWPEQPATARYKPVENSGCCPDTKPATKPVLDGSAGLLRPLLRAFKSWKLRREAVSHMRSFFAISEAMGLSPYSSKQTDSQQQRLKRVKDIADQLRQLNFSHLEAKP